MRKYLLVRNGELSAFYPEGYGIHFYDVVEVVNGGGNLWVTLQDSIFHPYWNRRNMELNAQRLSGIQGEAK